MNTPKLPQLPNWLPIAENINALPEPIRLYIADLETNADPAGTVRDLAIARDTIRALEASNRMLRDACNEVVGCFDAAESEGLQEALANTTDERLKDLVERRLMYALYACQSFASAPPAPQAAAEQHLASSDPVAHQQAITDHAADLETRAEIAEQQVVCLAEERDHFKALYLANKQDAVVQQEPVAYYTDWHPDGRKYAEKPHGFDEIGVLLDDEALIREMWHPLVHPAQQAEPQPIVQRLKQIAQNCDDPDTTDALDKLVVDLLQKQAKPQPLSDEHVTDGSKCWCDPELVYKDPYTMAEVWVHRGKQ